MKINSMNSKDIDLIRQKVILQTFRESIGERVLLLTEEFPFLVIGTIERVEEDFVFIFVETTLIDPLDNRLFGVHIDAVEVFYIEEPDRPIPNLCENDKGSRNWGDR